MDVAVTPAEHAMPHGIRFHSAMTRGPRVRRLVLKNMSLWSFLQVLIVSEARDVLITSSGSVSLRQ